MTDETRNNCRNSSVHRKQKEYEYPIAFYCLKNERSEREQDDELPMKRVQIPESDFVLFKTRYNNGKAEKLDLKVSFPKS